MKCGHFLFVIFSDQIVTQVLDELGLQLNDEVGNTHEYIEINPLNGNASCFALLCHFTLSSCRFPGELYLITGVRPSVIFLNRN